MRDIKFRGCEWNADNELLPFVYGKLCDVDVIRTIEGVDKVVHYKTVGQFTGLFDKNGKEIYEGDVINVPYNFIGNIKVVFEKGIYNISKYNISLVEIIGNIHTTPELL